MHQLARRNPNLSSSLPIVSSPPSQETVDSSQMLLAQWETFRREARKFENEIELKLDAFSAFSTTYSQLNLLKPARSPSAAQPLQQDQTAETHSSSLEFLLQQLSESINKIAPFVAEHDANPAFSPSLTPLLYHHRNKLQQFTTEFRKTCASIKQTREHAELLTSVRQDIDEARKANAGNHEAQYLRERSSLMSSNSISDNIIEQAYAARKTLHQQQEDLRKAFGKLGGVIAAVPGLSGVMRAIVRRRLRDRIIIAITASIMMILILWYWLSTP